MWALKRAYTEVDPLKTVRHGWSHKRGPERGFPKGVTRGDHTRVVNPGVLKCGPARGSPGGVTQVCPRRVVRQGDLRRRVSSGIIHFPKSGSP
jgi:hypothetical protein